MPAQGPDQGRQPETKRTGDSTEDRDRLLNVQGWLVIEVPLQEASETRFVVRGREFFVELTKNVANKNPRSKSAENQ